MARLPHQASYTLDSYVSSNKGHQHLSNTSALTIVDELREQDAIFSYAGYENIHNLPYPLTHIDTSPLDQSYQRCLDMPLRIAGQETYAIPEEWEALFPLIRDIIAHEQAHNPNWRDYYTYMTVDCTPVAAGQQQRHGGLHVDGFQGSRINPKTKVTRNYVMTTNGGTRFYQQPFIVPDVEKFNVFHAFDLQAKDYIVAEENTVYFMDAYTVHESGISTNPGNRTFLRVTYDLKRFDRLSNSHNSMLDYDWDMVERQVHASVQTPTLHDIQTSPYRKK